jgi:hypothetical protein
MSEIEKLYEDYSYKRGLNISLDQFMLFAEFFPAVLVILSDGIVDDQERIYLDRLNTNLANIFEEDGLSKEYIYKLKKTFDEEFDYLMTHLKEWKDTYLDALSEHLTHNPESKEIILDTLYLFASKSQDVDESENQMIQFLTQKLNLLQS